MRALGIGFVVAGTEKVSLAPKAKENVSRLERRILSSLLFSGVLSIPGKAAATRRKS